MAAQSHFDQDCDYKISELSIISNDDSLDALNLTLKAPPADKRPSVFSLKDVSHTNCINYFWCVSFLVKSQIYRLPSFLSSAPHNNNATATVTNSSDVYKTIPKCDDVYLWKTGIIHELTRAVHETVHEKILSSKGIPTVGIPTVYYTDDTSHECTAQHDNNNNYDIFCIKFDTNITMKILQFVDLRTLLCDIARINIRLYTIIFQPKFWKLYNLRLTIAPYISGDYIKGIWRNLPLFRWCQALTLHFINVSYRRTLLDNNVSPPNVSSLLHRHSHSHSHSHTNNNSDNNSAANKLRNMSELTSNNLPFYRFLERLATKRVNNDFVFTQNITQINLIFESNEVNRLFSRLNSKQCHRYGALVKFFKSLKQLSRIRIDNKCDIYVNHINTGDGTVPQSIIKALIDGLRRMEPRPSYQNTIDSISINDHNFQRCYIELLSITNAADDGSSGANSGAAKSGGNDAVTVAAVPLRMGKFICNVWLGDIDVRYYLRNHDLILMIRNWIGNLQFLHLPYLSVDTSIIVDILNHQFYTLSKAYLKKHSIAADNETTKNDVSQSDDTLSTLFRNNMDLESERILAKIAEQKCDLEMYRKCSEIDRNLDNHFRHSSHRNTANNRRNILAMKYAINNLLKEMIFYNIEPTYHSDDRKKKDVSPSEIAQMIEKELNSQPFFSGSDDIDGDIDDDDDDNRSQTVPQSCDSGRRRRRQPNHNNSDIYRMNVKWKVTYIKKEKNNDFKRIGKCDHCLSKQLATVSPLNGGTAADITNNAMFPQFMFGSGGGGSGTVPNVSQSQLQLQQLISGGAAILPSLHNDDSSGDDDSDNNSDDDTSDSDDDSNQSSRCDSSESDNDCLCDFYSDCGYYKVTRVGTSIHQCLFSN